MAWVNTVRKILLNTLLRGGNDDAPLNQPIKDLEDRTDWLVPAAWKWGLSSLSLGARASSGDLLSSGAGWVLVELYAAPPSPGRYLLHFHYQVTGDTVLRLILVDEEGTYVATLGTGPIVTAAARAEVLVADLAEGQRLMVRSEGGSSEESGLVWLVAQGLPS